MHNVTPMPSRNDDKNQEPDPGWFLAGSIGFIAWWLALALPFLLYGSNTLFFLLYTWPFFLALLPLCVLTGIALGSLLRGHLFLMLLLTIAVAILLFWLLFMLLISW